ncbi:PAP fibrillin [Fragilaria crotonensis]|nr:PAP fibrillin [Fragilaria crotonensis]
MKSVVILCTLAVLHSVAGLVQTPTTKALLKQYIQTNGGKSFDVVAHGGYYHLEKVATAEYGQEKLQKELKDGTLTLNDLNVVSAGGWYKVQQLAADPKGMLVAMIVKGIQSKKDSGATGDLTDETLTGLLALLEAQGKGFSADLVDGEWYSVLSKSSKSSPRLQKAVERQESKSLSLSSFSTSNFDIRQSKFFGSTPFFKRRIELSTTVAYNPIPLSWFFNKKGGYLDFVYLDSDIRVTKGNRGGIFVHFRPAFLEQALASS